MQKTKLLLASLLALCFTAFGVPVYAAGPVLTDITAAVDFGTVTAAITAVAALIVVVYLAWKGAKMVIGAVRGL